ncbi:hypothetical protein SFUMM280S_01064 [Streptomyces fumanus]
MNPALSPYVQRRVPPDLETEDLRTQAFLLPRNAGTGASPTKPSG